MQLSLYNYKGTVTRIIDGDTISATIQVGLDVQLNNQILRLKGINAPEMKGETRESAIAGAKLSLVASLRQGRNYRHLQKSQQG